MTAAARRRPGSVGRVPAGPAVLLAGALLGVALVGGPWLAARDSAGPTPEEIARYLEAYKHQHTSTAAPTEVAPTGDDGAPPSTPVVKYETLPDLTPEEIATFAEWYNHDQVGRTSETPVPSPTAEDVARFRQWYNHQRATPRITAVSPVETAPPDDNAARFLEAYKHRRGPTMEAAPAADEATPETVARFIEWYQHEGAPKSSATASPSPTPDDVVRYLEAYQHTGAPTPHAAPVVTALDVRPIYDQNVRPVAGPELPAPLPPPTPIPVVQESRPAPVPPPPSMETPKEPRPVAPPPPAPLPPLVVPPPPAAESTYVSPFDAILQQAGCSSCGTGGGLLGGHAAMDSGPAPSAAGPGCNCGSGNCIPGRLHGCSPCESDNVVGRFLCGVYECICCPDPCYDPHWIPLADAAFFVESARPQTQQKVGWDAGRNLTAPDAGEFFWARADGKGRGPNPANHANPNGLLGEKSVNYNDLWMYTEAALGNIGTFVYVPYRSLDGELVGHAAGFSDVQVGTKTLLFDCELLQIAFEFRTYIPSGNAAKGLGTGHVSLEPGLIVGLKVAQDTYFQGQMAEWIPLGGDPDYEGAILHYHWSFNQVLCRILPDVPLVGTAEFNGYSFQHGQFTDPVTGETRITGTTYFSIGPGLRLFVCDKIDFGVGTSFAVTDKHFAEELIRSEFRWRF